MSEKRTQSPTDVIRGRATNSEGLLLQCVRATATSIPGNVTRETRTSDKGVYQIAFSGGAGDYIMGVAMIGYVFRQFEIKRRRTIPGSLVIRGQSRGVAFHRASAWFIAQAEQPMHHKGHGGHGGPPNAVSGIRNEPGFERIGLGKPRRPDHGRSPK